MPLKGKEDRKIVAYCTGGIRCEKASAFLKEQGFSEVYQLKEGILNFCKEKPDSVWKGKCFVFDKRIVTKKGGKDLPVANCSLCPVPCDLYRNCRNVKCDKLFISCVECERKSNGCCSEKCLREFKRQCMIKSLANQGRRIKIQP